MSDLKKLLGKRIREIRVAKKINTRRFIRID